MKKPSSSFLLLIFAALLVSFQSYAQISVEIGRGNHGQGQGPRGPRPGQGQGQGQQPGQQFPDYNDYSQPQSQMIREEVRMNLRSYERMSLSTLLRLSYGQESGMELVSLSIRAQSLMNGPAQLDLLQNGRPVSSATVRRQLNEIILTVPMRTLISGLELQSVSEIYLESITAQVQSSYNPYPGPGPGPGYEQQAQPNSLITLQVNQSVRGQMRLPLEQLARQQMGISLRGAEIERVVVEGQSSYGRATSVQVELNGRPVGQVKYLSQGQTPLPIQSMEAVQSLALLVNGDAQISEIRIRVGQVRPQGPQYPQGPATQRVYVQQEVSSRYPLSLSSLLPYESRLIRSVTIEARARVGGMSQLILSGIYGGQQGSIMVNQNSARATIRLARPMSASELQLLTNSVIQVEALEIEFDQYYR